MERSAGKKVAPVKSCVHGRRFVKCGLNRDKPEDFCTPLWLHAQSCTASRVCTCFSHLCFKNRLPQASSRADTCGFAVFISITFLKRRKSGQKFTPELVVYGCMWWKVQCCTTASWFTNQPPANTDRKQITWFCLFLGLFLDLISWAMAHKSAANQLGIDLHTPKALNLAPNCKNITSLSNWALEMLTLSSYVNVLPLWLFSCQGTLLFHITASQNSNTVLWQIMPALYCTSFQFSLLAIITVALGLSCASLILTFHITRFINLALHGAEEAVWTRQARGDAETGLLMKRARF